MNNTVTLGNKPVRVELSPAAQRALDERSCALLAEMELYFSCLIRKRVRFRDAAGDDGSAPFNEHLQVRFRPVMTAKCEIDNSGAAPPVTDFPIARPEAFTPSWLRIDYRNGEWLGDYGFD
jgi:hypothetical protein